MLELMVPSCDHHSLSHDLRKALGYPMVRTTKTCMGRIPRVAAAPNRMLHLARDRIPSLREQSGSRLRRVSISRIFNQSQANDYRDTTPWIRAYLPYLIVFVTGYWTQLELYWILGTFSTDIKQSSRSGGSFRAFETAGQALSYGLNSGSILPIIPFYINWYDA
jgi:hypothetical protein